MKITLKLICLLPAVWLMPAPASAAEPIRPEVTVTPKAKAVAPAKLNAKPKAKAKPQLKARAQSKIKSPKAKPLPKAAKPDRPAAYASVADQVSVDENNLDQEVAAARRAVTENPSDVAGRAHLARASVVLINTLLHAEAVADTKKASVLEQKLITDLYDTGWRVQRMAQAGDSMARQATGFLLERGVLLEKDTNKSCAEFFVAAEHLAPAGWHAAQCLMKSSPERAWVQMERAAVRGHAAAQESMGRRCVGDVGAMAQDYTCARSWLAQSASQGRSRSQTLLAYLLMNGQGGPVDEPRAIRLYTLAADQGDADAQNNLGEIHELGRGTAPNPSEALRWYERAAERGLASAQFNAGRLWAIGVGDKKDSARARVLLLQAEGNGVTQAREVLNWLDRQGPLEAREIPAQAPSKKLPDESKSD